MWIVVEELWPELAEPLRATEYDPFHDDKRCFDFMAALQLKAQEVR
ncbi:hypothetical protein UFOVP75_34 [uncultured Caudovirales phage]|uniref:Uncharacterized protein n=1 Tax=uncultured Caudovirales phage TaxID=2100421 RepID=A0A6J5KZV6_9CAUD|nr:hypothetical protein UFOVP75_34 [uncultured Caudovirales phage]